MGEWYVILNLVLCVIALVVGLMASKRFAVAAAALGANYALNIAAVLHGYSYAELRVIAGALDLPMLVLLLWVVSSRRFRSAPTSSWSSRRLLPRPTRC